jgi:hypothetical protein
MESHDLEIEIGKDGKVRVKTAGAKGKSCLEYARLVEQIVGRTLNQELTAEFYEPDSRVQIDGARKQDLHQRRE